MDVLIAADYALVCRRLDQILGAENVVTRGTRQIGADSEERVMVNLTDNPFSIIQAVTACGVIVREATDGEIIMANQTAAQILDLPLRTLLGTEVDQRIRLLRPDGTPLPRQERPSALALRWGQAQWQVPVDIAYPDGRRSSVRVDAVPVRRDDGAVMWVVVSFVDASMQADAAPRI
jgi:PAS domain-containing protein